MVAIIKTGHSIRRIFFYNENKLDALITDKNGVQKPAAELLSADNYPMELAATEQHHRLNMLLKTAGRNPNITRNSVHISLNFAPGEELNNDQLKTIAKEYMEAIGFGEQPYLIYKHHDSGHPHIHIATTLVNSKGKGIRTQNIGRTLSEAARKSIEQRHGLVRAEEHKKGLFSLKPVAVEKVVYGRMPTKNAIANVLSHVLDRYQYTSLTELNAVLNLYNVHADQGKENSRIKIHNGLQFRLLDAAGKPIGIPIKASRIYTGTTVKRTNEPHGKPTIITHSPTLKYLEGKFRKNKLRRAEHAPALKLAISSVLQKHKLLTPQKFSTELKRQGIHVVERRNKEGRLYGITYVDHRNKSVFNGSDLGKEYSANNIAEYLKPEMKPDATLPKEQTYNPITLTTTNETSNLLEMLFQPEYINENIPYPLRPK